MKFHQIFLSENIYRTRDESLSGILLYTGASLCLNLPRSYSKKDCNRTDAVHASGGCVVIAVTLRLKSL